mmetsp:Transcript_18012/g.40337  ORF Transcript_18012/g.40337 Transcript_18012/m.40337 type:complete len:212 (+) Transcript_18012:637-1272(+)
MRIRVHRPSHVARVVLVSSLAGKATSRNLVPSSKRARIQSRPKPICTIAATGSLPITDCSSSSPQSHDKSFPGSSDSIASCSSLTPRIKRPQSPLTWKLVSLARKASRKRRAVSSPLARCQSRKVRHMRIPIPTAKVANACGDFAGTCATARSQEGITREVMLDGSPATLMSDVKVGTLPCSQMQHGSPSSSPFDWPSPSESRLHRAVVHA